MDEIKIIQKVVWSYVKRFPMTEFDDLFSEAFLAYYEVKEMYNPSKGEKSTFIWSVVNNKLNTLLKQEKSRTDKICDECKDETLVDFSTDPELIYLAKEEWEQICNSLSELGKLIIEEVLNNTDLYLPTDKPRKCRGIIMKHLRDKGWSWSDIWKTFDEIKTLIK